jgi:hypothetical protein
MTTPAEYVEMEREVDESFPGLLGNEDIADEVWRLGQLACTYAFFCGLYEAEKEVWRLRYGALRNSLLP